MKLIAALVVVFVAMLLVYEFIPSLGAVINSLVVVVLVTAGIFGISYLRNS